MDRMTTVELDLADEYDSDMSLIRSYLSDRARSPETIRSNKSNLRIIARFLKRARYARDVRRITKIPLHAEQSLPQTLTRPQRRIHKTGPKRPHY